MKRLFSLAHAYVSANSPTVYHQGVTALLISGLAMWVVWH